MSQASNHYDTLIIGGGPAGISAAMHLGFHERRVMIVDRKSSPMFFSTNAIQNYPGVKPLISARDILRKMRTELREYAVESLFGNVVKIEGNYPRFRVHIETMSKEKAQTTVSATTLVFATGISRKHPRVKGEWQKWLPFAAKKEISFYCPDCDSPLTAGKDVLIVNAGTANSALHVARCIKPYAQRIRIFMTEDGYVPFTKESEKILNQSGYEWMSGLIDDIQIEEPGERQVLITTDNKRFECNTFFVSWIGEPRSELVKTLGVKVDRKGSIVTDHRGKTNIEGVWAAGDVRPMTQTVATAVGSGVYAGLMIAHFLLDQS
ncbi:MAG: NAD(P)/FAD-dependent oxidoreductase [Candidatus Odinarchaeota archaeon]